MKSYSIDRYVKVSGIQTLFIQGIYYFIASLAKADTEREILPVIIIKSFFRITSGSPSISWLIQSIINPLNTCL